MSDYSFYLARRLSLSSSGRSNTPAIKVAVAAVALSIAVMIASVAVVIGFKNEIRNKIIGFNSHLSIYALPSGDDGENVVSLSPSLQNILDNEPYITSYSLEISIPAVLKTSSDFKGVYMRSLNDVETQQFLRSNIEEGSIPDFSKDTNNQKVLISRTAANQLGLKVGDRIDTYFFSDDIHVRPMVVAAIFNTHFDRYDGVLIYGSLPLVQSIAGLSAVQGSALHIRTDNFDNIPYYSALLSNRLAVALAQEELFRPYRVDNVINQGAGYFNWLELLDVNVIVVLTLMTLVAIATLISGLLILVLDKKKFIGLQRALGLSARKVSRVFVYLSVKVAIYGMLIGNLLIITLLYLQKNTHFLHLDPDSYYIDFVPVQIDWLSIAVLNAGVLVVIYLSLILPSRFAAKISPAETLAAE